MSRVRLEEDGFTCSCGYSELAATAVPMNVSGSRAAVHMADHVITNDEEPHAGCLECPCRLIYEPVVGAGVICRCSHSVGRHDQYCSFTDCANVAARQDPLRLIPGTPDAALLCEEHRDQVDDNATQQ